MGSDGNQKSTCGFKAPINVDEDGFIQKADFSSGNEHDSNYFETLLTAKETAVYADSSYQSKAHKNNNTIQISLKNALVKFN
ncbi:MAG: transposase [Ostreibacterium sp.]